MEKFTITLVKDKKGNLMNKKISVPMPPIKFAGGSIKWLPDKYKEEYRK